ncbi:MAG TPA: RNA polymerase sigma factor [Allosphingosinicella sp.]|nr:RNA polymerase sigma factor [Allosphingosinicella sp.]
MIAQEKPDYGSLDDGALAQLVAVRDPEAVRLVTRRNNQRLFRAAWSILKSRAEAEDSVQSAYLRAFSAIGTFEARASLSTWLTRIVINEALGRKRAATRRRRHLDQNSVTVLEDYREKLMRGSTSGTSPEGELMRSQIRTRLEQAIADLPSDFRLVFVLREIEGLSVEETADSLGIVPATVKTRTLRARRRLQEALAPELKTVLSGAFPFAGADCEAITEAVVRRFCGRFPEAHEPPADAGAEACIGRGAD